jgi:hypothetical protein
MLPILAPSALAARPKRTPPLPRNRATRAGHGPSSVARKRMPSLTLPCTCVHDPSFISFGNGVSALHALLSSRLVNLLHIPRSCDRAPAGSSIPLQLFVLRSRHRPGALSLHVSLTDIHHYTIFPCVRFFRIVTVPSLCLLNASGWPVGDHGQCIDDMHAF